MAISRSKIRKTLNLTWEVADFMRKTKGRPTDPTKGRYNWSEVVDMLLRKFIAEQHPDVVARIYEEEREDLLVAVRQLEDRARRDLGIPLETLLSVNGDKAGRKR